MNTVCPPYKSHFAESPKFHFCPGILIMAETTLETQIVLTGLTLYCFLSFIRKFQENKVLLQLSISNPLEASSPYSWVVVPVRLVQTEVVLQMVPWFVASAASFPTFLPISAAYVQIWNSWLVCSLYLKLLFHVTNVRCKEAAPRCRSFIVLCVLWGIRWATLRYRKLD